MDTDLSLTEFLYNIIDSDNISGGGPPVRQALLAARRTTPFPIAGKPSAERHWTKGTMKTARKVITHPTTQGIIAQAAQTIAPQLLGSVQGSQQSSQGTGTGALTTSPQLFQTIRGAVPQLLGRAALLAQSGQQLVPSTALIPYTAQPTTPSITPVQPVQPVVPIQPVVPVATQSTGEQPKKSSIRRAAHVTGKHLGRAAMYSTKEEEHTGLPYWLIILIVVGFVCCIYCLCSSSIGMMTKITEGMSGNLSYNYENNNNKKNNKKRNKPYDNKI